MNEWCHRNYCNLCCDDFPRTPMCKMQGESERLQKTKGHLGYRPPKDEATYRVNGTVYSSKSFALSIKEIWLIGAKCIAGKVKPPEENGLTLSHWRFAVFTYLKYWWKLERKCVKSYKPLHCAALQCSQVQCIAGKKQNRIRYTGFGLSILE